MLFLLLQAVSSGLRQELDLAQRSVNARLLTIPEVYLYEQTMSSKQLDQVYKTIHHYPRGSEYDKITSNLHKLKKRQSFNMDTREMRSITDTSMDILATTNLKAADQGASGTSVHRESETNYKPHSRLNPKKSNLFNRRKKGVHFGEATIEEENLV